jgi:glycogen debranching enzyme
MDSAIDDVIIRKHFFNKEEFHTPYPIPSLAINDPAFYPKASMYIWRGPTWMVFNWYIHKYFLKKGYEKEANHLISCVKKVIDKSGFREYYKPFTGEGYGANGFTWAGLIIDMINKEKGKVPVDV